MDLRLTEEQKMVQQTIRKFVEKELIPLENEVLKNEREGKPSLSKEVQKKLQLKAKEAGFWGINTPEEYGGADLGQMMQAIVCIEVAKTFVPFSFGGSADNILYYANEEQKQNYLIPTINGEKKSCFAMTEPGAGSDTQNIRMTAVKDGDEWVLNGEKTFITGGNEADFVMVIAITDKELHKKTKGRDGVTCFIADREMGWKSEFIHTMGEWGPAGLVFDNVRVPEKNILGELHGGYKLGLEWIGFARWIVGARAVGAAERLLQMALDYAKERETFGKPIAERQAIQWQIADSAVEIEAAKWLALNAAFTLDQGEDNRHYASMAKLYGSNMGNRVVDRVLQIHGGMGYTRELPIERWYREARLWRIYDGTDEIQRMIISRNLLKGHVKIGQQI
ncbi:acyl-CoA dehydrogenase family protein [Cytobacillus sp. FSL W7-1323]|uniref:Medium-chain specific acyl-CoA dehydrogenase, mitochondrial n=1 Tax=Cytobacillus kochii TaxID=859143 RepID=A0A248TNY2_9BACI|nr:MULTISPECIES: acyl-CoA dehydrogenase family protein [Cytobacillus]ASV69872.1 acyl-CoA dehydrogenase [Cytobacillus kochii]MCA1025848.1 acyl-CoA dehydrogenase family protein [Cytobacillus kochii]MCM3321551.1 acyl-CoA dehydrogenase family protein [Cytobacillus kochii]MCM3343615.1 acyl-CoA dehydrogenase family protein [Cytobacillus kochii]MDM5207445.1 acyl-CoA dehydrogenase family protein [Cytobacillus kochii]